MVSRPFAKLQVAASRAAAVATPCASRRLARIQRREQAVLFIFALPMILVLLAFFAYPLTMFLSRSFLDPGLTFEHFAHATDPLYLKVFGNTLEITALVTLSSLIAGYPVAYVLANIASVTRTVLLSLIIVPLWIGHLVKAYAWMVMLGDAGVINNFLISAGIIDNPIPLLYNRAGVVIGMTQTMLPIMVLPLLAVMLHIPAHLIRVAESLGARPIPAFLRVYLPLSLPGVGAGILLVFIITLGFFITPALLGGPGSVMTAMVIEQQVSLLFNWGFAAALSVVLLAVTLLLYAIYTRFMSFERLYGGTTN